MKKLFRSLLAAAALFVVSGGVSHAGDFCLDPSAIGASTTQYCNVFGFTFLGTSNVIYTSGTGTGVGDTFIDNGALKATAIKTSDTQTLLPGQSGLDVTWELGAIFNGLSGTNTSVSGGVVQFAFTPGVGTINLYASTTLNNQSNDPSSIAGDTLVATLTLVSGGGLYDFNLNDGSVDILAAFTFVNGNFLSSDLVGQTIQFAITDSNNNGILCVGTTCTNFSSFFGEGGVNGSPTQFFVSNDGSVKFATTAVPEPSSMLLLGSGLLGLAGFLRRRNKQ